MAGTLEHVDPVIRVVGMADRALILLVPSVHPVGIEGEIACYRWCGFDRRWVAPDGVLGDLVAGADGPVGSVALERAVGGVFGRLEEVHPGVLVWEVVDGQVPRLVQDLHPPAVDHGLTT